FDDGRPPKSLSNDLYLVNDLRAKLSKMNIDSNWIYVDSLLQAVSGYIGNVYASSLSLNGQKKGETYLRVLYDSVNSKIAILGKSDTSINKKLFFLKSLQYDIETYKARRYLNNRSWNLIRDNLMGERFIWLL